jgi:thioredoxin-dependent peroxiredoxin
MALQIGAKAYEFSLKDKNGRKLKLKEISSKFIVIYFYPKDNTPGCTIEAKEFEKLKIEFEKIDCKIIGISGGNDESKQKFCDKHKLTIQLLSDNDYLVAKRYEVFGQKSFMGRKYMGINRVTYILDYKKRVIKVYENVSPAVHAKEVLQYLKGL